CDFSVGLSRQLYGLTIASERPQHRMYEQWHPLGPVGVITAFNFPVAVWSWNSAVAAVCGDPLGSKPWEWTPLTALAVTRIAADVMGGRGFGGVVTLMVGDGVAAGEAMTAARRLARSSAAGAAAMGKKAGPADAARLGRTIPELGGNNGA